MIPVLYSLSRLCALLFCTALVGLASISSQAQSDPVGQFLVPTGSTWRYQNNGTFPGEDWASPNFPDANWPAAPAQLGYGDGDEATVIEGAAFPHPVTAYFRHSFQVDDSAAFKSLIIRLVRDDGAVVYLNGHEVIRDNMPDGTITSETLAASTADPNNENTFHPFTISADHLVSGPNVLAVEVHQVNVASSDLSFELELAALPEGDTFPTVSIRAQPDITSEPHPLALIAPGRFLISRTGSTAEPLTVHLSITGTADREADYEPLPSSVTISAGATDAELLVLPRTDNLVEGDETVVAEILPPLATFAPDPENKPYHIDPEHNSATVIIRDVDTQVLPVVSIVATVPETAEPGPTSKIRPGQFTVRRTGDLNTTLSVLLMYEGTATADADYDRLPDTVTFEPGIAEVELEVIPKDDALEEGSEAVHARLVLPPSFPITPYTIDPNRNHATVIIHDNGSPAVPTVEITYPQEGQIFPAGADIEIKATAIDPRGAITRLEFWNRYTLIGTSEIAYLFFAPPSPGTPVQHSFLWKDAPEGNHILIARGIDSTGKIVTSAPVHITVGEPAGTIVSVSAVDPEAFEHGVLAVIDPIRFVINRTGDLSRSLLVFYSLHGTATPETDYLLPNNPVEIPAGQTSVTVQLVPQPDNLSEEMETVALRLEPSQLLNPLIGYSIDPAQRTAGGAIYDLVRPAQGSLQFAYPENGAIFPLQMPIDLVVLGHHPDTISSVHFYAGDQKIGTAFRTTRPSQSPTEQFKIVWDNPPFGTHVLTARATTLPDPTNEALLVSDPITIHVGTGQDLPTVSIHRIRSHIFNPGPLGDYALDYFEIRRTGATNQPLQVFFDIEGNAAPGVDYEWLRPNVIIPAGQTAVQIRIKAIIDAIDEPFESVILTLTTVPPHVDPAYPSIYYINPQHPSATVQIIDGNTSPRGPVVTIINPHDGAVLNFGDPIQIEVKAIPFRGITQLDLLLNDTVIHSVEEDHLTFVLTNAPVGLHQLRARAFDIVGLSALSSTVRILVREADQPAFVRRDLPAAYIPGHPFSVELRANPPTLNSTYAVEDQPPTGWAVSEISHEGEFDSATGKVKFGPFTDGQARELSYVVTPPENAAGHHQFTGRSSINGQLYRIRGDAFIEHAISTHPADTDNQHQINLPEVTAYAAAWKKGDSWPTGPVPIPLDYVTCAAFIWKHGEAYTFDSTKEPPLCWTPAGPIPISALATGEILRSTEVLTSPGVSTLVTIHVDPTPGTISYAAEEHLPSGWTASEISDGGIYDPATGSIRWGLFMDAEARTLSYKVTPPARVASIGVFEGSVSFDGSTREILGNIATSLDPSTSLRIASLAQTDEGRIVLRLTGAPGQTCVLESSTNLLQWSEVASTFLPDGELVFEDNTNATGPGRFYRLRLQ